MTRPVTIVTGGGRGIGAACVLRLAEAGHDIALAYRADLDSAEAGAAAARNLGAEVAVVQADVTDEADIERMFSAAASVGPVTGLVNNAGATLAIGNLADTPVSVVRAVVDLNLTAALLCCRKAAQVLAPGGAIVNISSSATTIGSPHEWIHYAAAKAGVDTLTLGLSKELAPQGIRVNSVSPGLVDTDLHAAAGDPERPARMAPFIPMGRAGTPGEIAHAVAWLMSAEASYTSGAILRVAGGR